MVRKSRKRVGAGAGLLALILTVVATDSSDAQSPAPPTIPNRGMVATRSSEMYERSPFWRFLFGEGYRDVWSAPITVPVLDIRTFAGGLEPFRQGGNQSMTLHFNGKDGRRYVFRSAEKDINKALPDDLKDTPLGEVIRDQAAAMHPSGALAVGAMQEALDVLYARPTLVVLPNDPRLGAFRAEFAGMVGLFEERPDDKNGIVFAGAEKIHGADKLMQNLEAGMEDRFDSRDYLKLRLFDFIIGDTDRGGDNVDFAKFETGERDTYRTIARDRDYAFITTEGLVMSLARMGYTKLVTYNSRFPSLSALTFATRDFDRSHLVDLPWAVWDSTIAFVQSRLTNDVISRAIDQLPESHRRESGGEIAATLQARRDNLREVAQRFYRMVSEDADVFASDENEHVEIERHPDGSVTVSIWREGDVAGKNAPVFQRRFLPAETQEIRVFLERGNDRAVVRGAVERSIEVRIIGGEGDDVLVDSSRVAHGDKTHFYDASGSNTIVAGARTRVVRTPYVIPPPKWSYDKEDKPEGAPRVLSEERRGRFKDLHADPDDFVQEKTQQQMVPTFGKSKSWQPMVDFRQGSGVVFGFGPSFIDYGFRRMPYESRMTVVGMVGASGDLAIQLEAQRYFEASPWSVSLFAHASQLEANRFFGYGNDTEFVDRRLSLVQRDEVRLRPALSYRLGEQSELSAGPVLKYSRPHLREDGPAGQQAPFGSEAVGQVGASAELTIDRADKGPAQQSGFEVTVGASGYPRAWDLTAGFGEANAVAQLYLPISSLTLALRAGGQRVWGTFPLHEAAFIGGRRSLRGFSYNRYAGDASAFGAAELRVPIARITLLSRGDFGVLGFTDAGRVWLDGESAGDWHTGVGGGVWFASLGQAISVTYAKGEQGRFYLSLGMPF